MINIPIEIACPFFHVMCIIYKPLKNHNKTLLTGFRLLWLVSSCAVKLLLLFSPCALGPSLLATGDCGGWGPAPCWAGVGVVLLGGGMESLSDELPVAMLLPMVDWENMLPMADTVVLWKNASMAWKYKFSIKKKFQTIIFLDGGSNSQRSMQHGEYERDKVLPLAKNWRKDMIFRSRWDFWVPPSWMVRSRFVSERLSTTVTVFSVWVRISLKFGLETRFLCLEGRFWVPRIGWCDRILCTNNRFYISKTLIHCFVFLPFSFKWNSD